MNVNDAVGALDRFQRRRPRLSFVVAVVKKYGDDQGGHLAALMAYYAFISLFGVLLASVTILGFVLQGDPKLQHDILGSTFGRLPVIGDQLQRNPSSLRGSGVALAIGVIVSLLAGLGIMQAAQAAFNRVWDVPIRARPNFLVARLQGLLGLALLGGVNIASTVLSGIVAAGHFPGGGLIGGLGITLAANLFLFVAAFRLLTAADLSFRTVLPGAIIAAIGWAALQYLGGYLVNHQLHRGTGETYGLFAYAIGLLAFLYVGAQLTVLAAEVNVVLARRLWPRGLTAPLTDADRSALRHSAEVEERVDEQQVDVTFER